MPGKFDIQKIINDVKSIVTPAPIPEANKDDPVGYHLSELNKAAKELAENHTKQADAIAKINATLGELYQAIKGGKSQAAPAPAENPALAEGKSESEPKAEAPAKSDKPEEKTVEEEKKD